MPPFPPATRAAAPVTPLRRLRPHVQADRRYDRWGSYSLLLLVIVSGYSYLTATARYTTSGWEVYDSPAMFLLEYCAVLGGVILAGCLGLVATLVRSRLERTLGSLGVVVAAYCLFVMFADTALQLQVSFWRRDLLALVFGASQYIGDKNLMERTLGSQIHLPKPVWGKLNLLWVANFVIVGGLNLVVAYGYSEDTWVSYKLYSSIGFTLLLTILTALLISPHLKDDQEQVAKE